ncbi:hypothetical protein PybrP1_002331 [[Pythium] brassicae (nom. inval.)]|nr:hypothetical protein PybrP1_002331 [[Pythium] brassicae (nom. inval.)]
MERPQHHAHHHSIKERGRVCSREDTKAKLREVRRQIERAQRIFVVGGGSFGSEVAEAFKAKFPNKAVTKLMPAPSLSRQTRQQARPLDEEARHQADPENERLSERLSGNCFVARSARDQQGTHVESDIQLLCGGFNLVAELILDVNSSLVDEHGFIEVKSQMQLVHNSFGHVIALGDASNHVPPKMAKPASEQAKSLAAKLLAVLRKSQSPFTMPFVAPKRICPLAHSFTFTTGDMVLLALARFCFLALTDAAMVPALGVMKRNHRHFELFVGVFQLCIAFCFNAAEALRAQLFLRELQWHFISDVLSITYFLLLCVHLMGFRDEDRNIVLRYVAFALSWLMKAKDGWDSTVYEVLLVASYVAGAAYRRLLSTDKSVAPLNKEKAKLALLFLALAALAGGIPIYFGGKGGDGAGDSGALSGVGFGKGCMHLLGGAAFYYAWLAVPCLDSKKTDIMPTYSAYV